MGRATRPAEVLIRRHRRHRPAGTTARTQRPTRAVLLLTVLTSLRLILLMLRRKAGEPWIRQRLKRSVRGRPERRQRTTLRSLVRHRRHSGRREKPRELSRSALIGLLLLRRIELIALEAGIARWRQRHRATHTALLLWLLLRNRRGPLRRTLRNRRRTTARRRRSRGNSRRAHRGCTNGLKLGGCGCGAGARRGTCGWRRRRQTPSPACGGSMAHQLADVLA